MEIKNNTVYINPPKQTLKITGHRFATILGADKYSTPFEAWAEICKIYRKPFEETKYTKAGNVVEPKQAEYIKNRYNLPGLVSPAEFYAEYGPDFKIKLKSDFFPESKECGGMWDYLNLDTQKQIKQVIECKTAQEKRKVEWEKGSIPFNYQLQAALYTYLKGIDNCVMVATFLKNDDYDHPEDVVVSKDNTKVIPFRVSMMNNFKENYYDRAIKWWNKHVVTGISPAYDPNNPIDVAVLNYLIAEEKKKEAKQNFTSEDLPFY